MNHPLQHIVDAQLPAILAVDDILVRSNRLGDGALIAICVAPVIGQFSVVVDTVHGPSGIDVYATIRAAATRAYLKMATRRWGSIA